MLWLKLRGKIEMVTLQWGVRREWLWVSDLCGSYTKLFCSHSGVQIWDCGAEKLCCLKIRTKKTNNLCGDGGKKIQKARNLWIIFLFFGFGGFL